LGVQRGNKTSNLRRVSDGVNRSFRNAETNFLKNDLLYMARIWSGALPKNEKKVIFL